MFRRIRTGFSALCLIFLGLVVAWIGLNHFDAPLKPEAEAFFVEIPTAYPSDLVGRLKVAHSCSSHILTSEMRTLLDDILRQGSLPTDSANAFTGYSCLGKLIDEGVVHAYFEHLRAIQRFDEAPVFLLSVAQTHPTFLGRMIALRALGTALKEGAHPPPGFDEFMEQGPESFVSRGLEAEYRWAARTIRETPSLEPWLKREIHRLTYQPHRTMNRAYLLSQDQIARAKLCLREDCDSLPTQISMTPMDYVLNPTGNIILNEMVPQFQRSWAERLKSQFAEFKAHRKG